MKEKLEPRKNGENWKPEKEVCQKSEKLKNSEKVRKSGSPQSVKKLKGRKKHEAKLEPRKVKKEGVDSKGSGGKERHTCKSE